MASISGKTKICGIIGDPIEHTMSPAMQNAAFQKLGMDYVYVAFHVKAERLGQALAGMRALNIKGMNVTIPHKVAVVPFLDELDPLAERIGAANTIVNNNGILAGFNTDAEGFLQALLEAGVKPKGKKAVILGAGGGARAVSFMLADQGAHLTILNRAEEFDWAEKLAARISQVCKGEVRALTLEEKNLAVALDSADILVNATSVGMTPNVTVTPVPARLLKPGLIVFDIVYNPVKTRLMREAEAVGARTISGLEMLVWQGALAFEKWTGQKAPHELMRREAMKGLGL